MASETATVGSCRCSIYASCCIGALCFLGLTAQLVADSENRQLTSSVPIGLRHKGLPKFTTFSVDGPNGPHYLQVAAWEQVHDLFPLIPGRKNAKPRGHLSTGSLRVAQT